MTDSYVTITPAAQRNPSEYVPVKLKPTHQLIKECALLLAKEQGFPAWLTIVDYDEPPFGTGTGACSDFGLEVIIQDYTFRTRQFTPHPSINPVMLRKLLMDHFSALWSQITTVFEVTITGSSTIFEIRPEYQNKKLIPGSLLR